MKRLNNLVHRVLNFLGLYSGAQVQSAVAKLLEAGEVDAAEIAATAANRAKSLNVTGSTEVVKAERNRETALKHYQTRMQSATNLEGRGKANLAEARRIEVALARLGMALTPEADDSELD